MAIVIRCDRCGAICQLEEGESVGVTHRNDSVWYVQLCRQCLSIVLPRLDKGKIIE